MNFDFLCRHPIIIVFIIWAIGFILGYDFERFLNWLFEDKDKEIEDNESEEI